MENERANETKEPKSRKELWRGDKEKFWSEFKRVDDEIVEQCHRNRNPGLYHDGEKL